MKIDKQTRAIHFDRKDEVLCHTRRDVSAEVRRDEQTGEKSYVSRGYAILFNSPTKIWDWGGQRDEIVLKSAFDKIDFADTPLLWNHDTSEPMGWNGVNLRIEKDDVGVFWELNHYANPIEKDRHDKMSSGKMGCSFGFCCNYEDRADGKRYITEITELIELTVTAFPAYKDTVALAMRDYDKQKEKREEKKFTLADALNELKKEIKK